MKLWIVFFEKAQCHYGFGTFLYFVEEKKCFVFCYWHVYVVGYFGSDEMHIYVVCKKAFDCFVSFKIHFGKELERFSKMTYGRRFADLSCSSNQQRFTHGRFFPGEQLCINVSLYILWHNGKYL